MEGRRVLAVDASDVVEKGRNGETCRLHYAIDLHTMTSDTFKITKGETGETLSNFDFRRGDLAVADRAYGTLNGIAHCRNCGADYILRLRTNCFAVYDEKGNKVDIAGGFSHLKSGESSEAAVFAVLPDKTRIPVRICIKRKEKEACEKTRKRLDRRASRKGNKLREKTVLFIDGTTEEIMPDYKNTEALYHFTPIGNIPSILEHGLLSRDQCENINNIIVYNIYGICTDKDRHDGRKDCISCSINKPYFNMLRSKRRDIKKYGGIAILRMGKEIINKSNYALFVNGNAAEKENARKTYEELNDPNNILDKNNEYKLNAEILIKDYIPLSYIESFNFSMCDFPSYIWAEWCKFYSRKWDVKFCVNNKIFGKYYSDQETLYKNGHCA